MRTHVPAGVDFSKLEDWKTFERLTADLLEADGFALISEPAVDKSGADLIAEETLVSHSGVQRRIRWLVQCKHYAGSGRAVGRKDVEETLYCFAARSEDGLLIVTDTNLSEEALRVLETHSSAIGGHRFVRTWNRRELENRLVRHPRLLSKYGLSSGTETSTLLDISLAGRAVLFISDSGALAHDLASRLRSSCDRLDVITLWQYADENRCELLFGSHLREPHHLIIVFLGDSFGFPIPSLLLNKIRTSVQQGAGLILMPFLAWARDRGQYAALADLVPVVLSSHPDADQAWLKASRLLAAGDLSFLADESFIENQSTVFRVACADHGVTSGLSSDFEVIHTYEFVHAARGAKVLIEDSVGTPLVVEHPTLKRVFYLNSSTHCCLSAAQVFSPLSSNRDYALLLKNLINQALGPVEQPSSAAGLRS